MIKTQDDVQHWARWICSEFGIAWANMDGIDGQRLLELTRDDFLTHWPQLVGEVPWEHVMYLKKLIVTNPNHNQDIISQVRQNDAQVFDFSDNSHVSPCSRVGRVYREDAPHFIFRFNSRTFISDKEGIIIDKNRTRCIRLQFDTLNIISTTTATKWPRTCSI